MARRRCFSSCARQNNAALSRLQHQFLLGILLHQGARVAQREIAAFIPHIDQVAVVRASWLATLAGGVNRQRIVPIRSIQNFAIACPAGLRISSASWPRTRRPAGGIHGVAVTRTLHRALIKDLNRAGLNLVETIAEAGSMGLAPAPGFRSAFLKASDIGGSRGESCDHQVVSLLDRLVA